MKYVKNFKNLDVAREAGELGMYTPHLDNVMGYGPINLYMGNADDEKFNGDYDDDGNLIVRTPVSGHCYGEICYESNNTGELAFCSLEDWREDLGYPIAVCVVPTGHEKYGGAASFVSLYGVDEAGEKMADNRKMKWSIDSAYRSDELLSYDGVVISEQNVEGSPLVIAQRGNIPSDWYPVFTGERYWKEPSVMYYDGGVQELFVPGPYYTNDDAVNPDHSYYEEGGPANVFTDYNGAKATKIMAMEGNCLLANAASKYHTNLTEAGQWYVPTAAEISYIFARLSYLTTICERTGGVTLGIQEGFFWTINQSKEESKKFGITNAGVIEGYTNVNLGYLRPFILLP